MFMQIKDAGASASSKIANKLGKAKEVPKKKTTVKKAAAKKPKARKPEEKRLPPRPKHLGRQT